MILEIDGVFDALSGAWGGPTSHPRHRLLAAKEDLPTLRSDSRQLSSALDVSTYSLGRAHAQAAAELMEGAAARSTLTYLGAERSFPTTTSWAR
jgi:hypothetical protein